VDNTASMAGTSNNTNNTTTGSTATGNNNMTSGSTFADDEDGDDTATAGAAATRTRMRKTEERSSKGAGERFRPRKQNMKRATVTLVLLLLTTASAQAERTSALLAKAWPAAPYADLENIGTGIGIVFSPDLSVPGNCAFYEALGFACFSSADWLKILSDIHSFNLENPGRRIRTLILETHGTNGHGLKVQTGKREKDDRSYIAVAALEEILEPVGLRHIIISACNSGRLLRPEIYKKLNRDPGDKLWLPATLGVIDATEDFDERRSRVTVITPATSTIETTVVGKLSELSPDTREALKDAAKKRGVKLPSQFAVSEMLIQMLLRDPKLQLRTGVHVEELGKEQTPPEQSEKIFAQFVEHLDSLASRNAATRTANAASR
jgi:hypothetical protein